MRVCDEKVKTQMAVDGQPDGNSYISVPEMHNDFIFSYIGQTLGFVGAMAVVFVFSDDMLQLIPR